MGSSNRLHPSVTLDHIIEAVKEDDNIGFCINCGSEQDGCEPDARAYLCENCGSSCVYGAEELLIMVVP